MSTCRKGALLVCLRSCIANDGNAQHVLPLITIYTIIGLAADCRRVVTSRKSIVLEAAIYLLSSVE